MPGLSSNQVTLSEVLEVRGGPLYEDEIWALIYESCDAAKDTFLQGNTRHLLEILQVLCPENIILCGSGKVRFGTEIEDDMILDRRFVPPERFMLSKEEVTDLGIEKMLIYAVGMIIYAAAEFGCPSVAELCLSSELETLLLYMCEDDPYCRCSLVQVFQACNSSKGIYLSVERIKSMVKSILGNDIPLDDSPSGSKKLSMTSSVHKMFSPTSEYSQPFPVGSLRALTPLSNTRVAATTQLKDLTRDDYPRGNNLTEVSTRSLVRTYKSVDNIDSGESYEPLRKKPEHEKEAQPVALETRAPVKEDSMKFVRSDIQEEALDRLPPVGKVASLPRDQNKSSTSSTYATPSFKRLIASEKRKLTKDGFFDEERSKIKFVDSSKFKSMPTLLNSGESESPRSGKGSAHSAEYPYAHQKGNYRKLTRFASKDSMDSASLAASQYSSTLSLNYGSYTLDSQNANAIHRLSSAFGGSSNDGSAFDGPGSFRRVNESLQGGPEFVFIPHDPELAIIDITPPRLGPIPRGRRKISIMLPNAQRLDTLVETSAVAKEVFDEVTTYLGLKETVYFGLTQIKDSEHIFLKLESKLTKYAPSGWKDNKKNKVDFILHFKVKFFLENIDYLRNYKTKHLFYLQLRREILCGYIFCHDEAAMSLASLALQAEYSDYVEQYHGRCYFEAEHYLPGRMLSRLSRSDIYHHLPLLHHSYRGLREDEAEVRFLKEAQRLKEYGALFYHVSRSKKDPKDSILLGICVKGIVLYEVRGQNKTEIHRQLWHMIEKFSFSRKKFVVVPKQGIGLPTLNLYTNSYKKAKYLLKMCESFHLFSKYSRPWKVQSDNASTIGSSKISPTEDTTAIQKENKAPNTVDSVSIPSSNTPRKKNRPKSQPELQTAVASVPENGLKAKSVEIASQDIDDMQKRGKDEGDEYGELGPFNAFSPRTRRRLSSLKDVPERRIAIVTLKRKIGQGLGITIVGGEDTKRLGHGIFIKTIAPDGLAAKEGTLQIGDRILSYNGQSLEQITHDEAVAILKDAKEDVQLIVSQFKSAGTSFLDKTGLSTLDEGNFSPVLSSPASVSHKRTTGAQEVLKMSPIARVDEKAAKNARRRAFENEGKTLKSGKVIVDESEIMVAEDEMVAAEPVQSLNSTPSLETRSLKGSAKGFEERRAEDESEYDPDVLPVILRKRNNSFGITITGGRCSGFPYPNVYIQSVDPGGPAEGKINIGDCLLQVNGIDIREVTHKQAVEVLRKAPTESVLLISKSMRLQAEEFDVQENPPVQAPKSSRSSSRSNSSSSTKDTFIVEIDKGLGGLGLSLAGGVGSSPEFKDRIMVRRLFPGQPAAACGKLRIGDIILSVNGTKISGLTQQEAINLLRKKKASIELVVKRPHPNDIPEELLIETPRESLDPKSVLENIQKKLSESATRQMPEVPVDLYSDEKLNSKFSEDHRHHSTDSEYIVPYSESLQNAEPEPPTGPIQDTKRLSTHEVLVHAQISGFRPKPTKSISDASKGDESRESVDQLSEDQLENAMDQLLENFSDPALTNEDTMHQQSERQSDQSGSWKHVSQSSQGDPNWEVENRIPADDFSEGYSDHELSLPELPSSDEIRLKLPDYHPGSQGESGVMPESKLEIPSFDQHSQRSSTSEHPGSLPSLPDETDLHYSKETTKIMENGALQDSAIGPISNSFHDDKFSRPVNNVDIPSQKSGPSSEIVEEKLLNVDHSNGKSDYEYFEVSLTKGAMGLGFTLAGGKSTTGGCFIREIVSDPAKSCGKLKSGDQIVMVDAVDISQFEHMNAVETLRGTSSHVTLGIKRQITAEKPKEKVYGFEMVTLTRNQRGRLGLILGQENGDIIVGDIIEDEPASLSGDLRYGDKIKEINDIPLKGMDLDQAKAVLDEAIPVVQLTIERRSQANRESRYALNNTGGLSADDRDRAASLASDRSPQLKRKLYGEGLRAFKRSDSLRSDSSVSSTPRKGSITNSPILKRLDVFKNDQGYGSRIRKSSSQEDKGEIILVQLEKGTAGLGLSLTGNNDYGEQCGGAFIANINPGGIAHKTGKLRKGDKIISINGEKVDDKQQKEVVAVLRETKGKVSLEVFRYPPRQWLEARTPSYAGSIHSDYDDLDLDFHLTESHELADKSALSEKLLALLPTSNGESIGSEETQEPKNLKLENEISEPIVESHDLDIEKDEILEILQENELETEPVDFLIERKASIGLNAQNNGELTSGIENEVFQDKSQQDISWNDSDLSDEEHFKSSEQATKFGSAKIQKSSISTRCSDKMNSSDKSSNDVTVREASISFSSTFEKVTPSSSIVSSILDEISPVESSDEDSDFELSASMIPDLSSFKPEDREAFEKYFNNKEEKEVEERTKNENLDVLQNNSKEITANTPAAKRTDSLSEKSDPKKDFTDQNEYMDPPLNNTLIREKEVKNQDSVDSGHVTQARGSLDHKSDNSWKEDDNEESLSDEAPFMDPDSLDVEMALEEYEMRHKEEFNDTLKYQIMKERLENETSFTNHHEIEETVSSPIMKEGRRSLSPGKDFHTESKIPKLDPRKVSSAASPPRKSPAGSGIPVFSPSRSPTKMTTNIEMKDKSYDTEITKGISDMETTFTKKGSTEKEIKLTGGGINGDMSEKIALEIGFSSDSDLSFDSDEDVTINITDDTLSFGQDEIDTRISHYQMVLESDRVDREFQEVKDVRSTDSCDVARRSANRDKNRFRSILPFDKTRVCLAGGEENDYINASHVKVQMGEGSFNYIAAQGPLSNTVDDFWRLIWEQKVETIVMVTKDVEAGKVKCHRYWPDLPGLVIKASDRFKIDLVHRKENGNFIESQLSLLNTKLNKSVTVNHLLYIAWPETGVPKEPLPFLMFVKYSAQLHSSGPLLVHCSAGTGRSGLFIITDVLNKMIPREHECNILDLVKSLKQMRQSLIQTKDQYMFCYRMAIEILREEKHITY